MRLRWRTATLVSLWLLLSLPAAAQPPLGHAAFLEGLSAYRSQDFVAARDAFQQAYDAGHPDPNVLFNLGLSHFRLGDWSAARVCFERLRAHPRYAAVALYQLALLEARATRQAEALTLLAQAESLAQHPAVRDRIRAARQRLAPELDGGRRALRSLYLGGGYDGNPSLIRDSADLPRLTEGRHYLELQAVAQWNPADRQAIDATLYAREYPGGDRYDHLGALVAWRRSAAPGTWDRSMALALELTQLDNEVLQQLAHVEGHARRLTGATQWDLRAQFSGIRATGAFELLSGWRLRTGAQVSRRFGTARALLDLGLSFNERRDLAVDDAFFSQSPVRGKLQLGVAHGDPGRLALHWHLQYRHSYFRHENRSRDLEGNLVVARRRDDLLSAGLLLRRQLAPSLSVVMEARYDDNTSTQALFDYHRPVVSAGLEWLP